MCVLASERLLLRAPSPRDISAMAVWLGDLNVARNMTKVPHPYTERDAADFVAAVRPRAPGHHHVFSVLRARDGLFLGGVGLHEDKDGVEMGYWLGRPFWGQGFASEAARRMAAYAFDTLGLTQITASWFHDNPASGRVLDKLGARVVGQARRDCRARGAQVAVHVTQLTREHFLRKQAA